MASVVCGYESAASADKEVILLRLSRLAITAFKVDAFFGRVDVSTNYILLNHARAVRLVAVITAVHCVCRNNIRDHFIGTRIRRSSTALRYPIVPANMPQALFATAYTKTAAYLCTQVFQSLMEATLCRVGYFKAPHWVSQSLGNTLLLMFAGHKMSQCKLILEGPRFWEVNVPVVLLPLSGWRSRRYAPL